MGDDGLTHRNVCAARFNRNHRLLGDIFSEFSVPDVRSIVTSQRMDQLKKQVCSLEAHQEKLKQELRAIDEKNETKKRSLLDSSSKFAAQLAKFRSYTYGEKSAQLKEMYERQYESLQREWLEHATK